MFYDTGSAPSPAGLRQLSGATLAGMSRRAIRLLAVFNVLAAASLFVWFKAIPQQSHVSATAQQVVDQATEVDAAFRLQLTRAMRDGWEHRATQYGYWAMAAGFVVIINAGVSFWHLLIAEAEPLPANQRLRLTGDARG